MCLAWDDGLCGEKLDEGLFGWFFAAFLGGPFCFLGERRRGG